MILATHPDAPTDYATAEAYVRAAIAADGTSDPNLFYIDKIVDTCHYYAGGWDLRALDGDRFDQIVDEYAL